MVWPSSRSGAGQDLVSTFLTPRAISVAQGWCRVMAYTGSSREGTVMFHGGHSAVRGYHGAAPGAGPGPDLGDEAGGHRGPDDVVTAVVLDADAVEGLDVDGVGSSCI